MSRDSSFSRAIHPSENEFENSWNQMPGVPSRAPLNSIPDPSQYQLKTPNHHDLEERPESSKESRRKKSEGIAEISSFLKTPKVHGRSKSTNSEPNSAQSTPTRNGPRVSVPGSVSGPGFPRFPSQLWNGGGKGGALPRVPRRFSIATPQQLLTDVPHFELEDDPSFWNDHNVQVLIRIRPLNTTEMISQGYGRCLRQESAQSVVWLGHPETRFTFDHIAGESISQENLFRVAGLPMVDNCMSGYNSCMFAYGQTGSGKTYTMMGELDKMDQNLNEDCGITPRIFEYLFSRITKEEESRTQQSLTYSCKCSFLEIYNEQITDLLEPSSTNLQLREDMKKGVYVENLTEHCVRTVNDVLQLLQQGSANRKIAATHMNSESSRSHSVFTCVIESRWEKDSMTHLRFGRLNLVDLAGSERQKGSGAEGDRLKEAANINKSLSTLGLVIMSLVDLAQGKHRHVPYRDSRLTFLLQDSLGGNSKTTIIANVSPSICSANETLSTLKFAQRAKLIQNNAKINEDASAGVIALQQQIQQLKDQLSFLMKHPHNSMEHISFVPRQESSVGCSFEGDETTKKTDMHDEHETDEGAIVKKKYIKANLDGALRRERFAETEIKRLKADIKHLNCLAHQQQEEAQHAKMILKFRDEKIKRMELLLDGSISADKFYLYENSALREENQLLQEKIERNPEVIRLATENIRLLEKIGLFQDFYEHGEREALQAEISELRNQLMDSIEAEKSQAHHQISPTKRDQDPEVTTELQKCKDMNSKLLREVNELQQQLSYRWDSSQDTFNSIDDVLLRRDSVDEAMSYSVQGDEVVEDKNDEKMANLSNVQCKNTDKLLMDAQCLIKAMKLEHLQLIRELESLKTENQHLANILERNRSPTVSTEGSDSTAILGLQAKLEELSKELKEVQMFNNQYIEDHATRLSQDHQTELVRSEVEMETTRTIIHLQDEIDKLQSEFRVCVCSMAEENLSLRNSVAANEDKLRVFCAEWEKATLELTTFLTDGSRSLRDASHQIKNISSSFPKVNDWINEHVERAAKACVEKEETILLLQSSLEDAQTTVMEMEQKLFSLKDATMALTAFQQPEKFSIEEIQLTEVKEFTESELVSEKGQIIDTQAETDGNENQQPILQQVRNELVEINTILSSMNACLCKVYVHFDVDSTEVFTETDGCAVDSCSSVEESCKTAVLLLRMEFRKTYEAFVKLKNCLMVVSIDQTGQNCLADVLSFSDLDAMELNEQGNGLDQPTSKRPEECIKNCGELAAKSKHSPPDSFFAKYEEAYSAINEADYMLKAMLKANENANNLTAMWKQTGEKLMSDNTSLSQEIKQLKSCVLLSDEEKEALQDAVQFSSSNVVDVLSSLEECFRAMQTGAEELFETARTDAIKVVEETQTCFGSFRSSLEDLIYKAMQNDIIIFVLQCQMGENSDKFRRLTTISNSNYLEPCHVSRDCNLVLQPVKYESKECQVASLSRKELIDHIVDKSSEPQRELEWKDVILKGLLYDFTLLQEFASHRKDIKDELEKLIVAMSQVQQELQIKNVQLDDTLVQKTKLEGLLFEAEQALSNMDSDLDQAKAALNISSEQNVELKDILKDLYLKNSKAEQLLEDQREAIKSLEKEIILLSSQEKQSGPSVEDYEDALTQITVERDQLLEKLTSLQDALDMVSALSDENQAIAAEARQESETSKMYAEQKEEEVMILERSVEELDSTINVLEKKVHEMEEEVEKQRLIRDSLELELQALRERLLTVEDLTECMSSENSCSAVFEEQFSRKLHERALEIKEARSRIRSLEEENAKQAQEIGQFKDYISELVLHSEAQASQYQQKYKALEAMLDNVKTDVSTAQTSERADKVSAKARGSSSPFRCIGGFVQQMNQEKDQELSNARSRIEELEALAAVRYKEVCALNTRLATAESMTHDVIRDLLSVKLDISNYANIVEQHQLQKLIEEAHRHRQDFATMEQEIVNLRSQIDDLLDERERCYSEINRNKADQLAIQIALEQLQERDQFLIAQNDMLKMDKSNLQKRVAELDDMVKRLFSMQDSQPQKTSSSRPFGLDLGERLGNSQKVLSRANDQLGQYRRLDVKMGGDGNETKPKGRHLSNPRYCNKNQL